MRYEVMFVDDAFARGFLDREPWSGADYYVCVDTMLRRVICSDGGEPEDRNLYRDFKPLVDELNRIADKRTVEAVDAGSDQNPADVETP